MAGSEKTKRAEILLNVLDCLNRDACDDFKKYLIFGGSLDDLLADALHPGHGEESKTLREVRELGDALSEGVADAMDRRGRTIAAHRTSLDPPTEEKRALKGLGHLEQLNRALANELRRVAETPYSPPATPGERDIELDLLDRRYAGEVLGKLSKIVRRAFLLEPLDLSAKVPDEVRGYFAEAHRCYLYNFPIACAVLCRAILASALEREIDPTGAINNGMLPKKSYFERLVKEAEGRNILTDDRPEWALKVRDAGNEAVHDLGKFIEHWDGKLNHILLNTRKVLIDLYEHEG